MNVSPKTLILMVGLPRSGKSTWAKQQGLPIVSRDAVRLALHGERFLAAAEPMVSAIEETMIKALFRAGHNTIIIDECHINAKRRCRWVGFDGAHVECVVINTPRDVCIERAKAENDQVIIPVIERMFGACDVPLIKPSFGLEQMEAIGNA